MRVLVTGAFGYVGHAVVNRLVNAGHEVLAVTHRRNAAWEGNGAVKVVHADLLEHEQIRPLARDVDAVCHLAALTRVRESFDRADEYQQVNVAGTLALLASAADRAQVAGRAVTFIQASTAAVYGTPMALPIPETAALAPNSPYGASKLAADRAVEEYTRAGGIAGISVRAFNIAGAVHGRGDTDRSRIIPNALAVAAGRSTELTINGDGSASRDFVHVADLAQAYALALGHAVPGMYRAYNVGATTATVREIVHTAEEVTGRTIPVRYRPSRAEPVAQRADTRLIRDDLGWIPKRSTLTEIITDAWAVEQPSVAQ